MYKMIVLDLDGTLLNDYKEVSKENINLIKRAYNEKGIISVIATGRPLGYANQICNLYGNCFANYIIACNGAVIKNNEMNEYIRKVTFTNEEILNFRKIFLEENADYMMLYTDEQVITETKNGKELKDIGASINQKKTKAENIENVIKSHPNLIKLLCLIGGDTLALEKIIEKVNRLDGIESSVICNYLYKTEENVFESKYIDIMKKGCSKKNAIHILAEKLGIKQEEIIVMGDGGNDISMFECAGLKIAMANAEKYLKEKADFVTTSNNENGVANAIKKFIFNEK